MFEMMMVAIPGVSYSEWVLGHLLSRENFSGWSQNSLPCYSTCTFSLLRSWGDLDEMRGHSFSLTSSHQQLGSGEVKELLRSQGAIVMILTVSKREGCCKLWIFTFYNWLSLRSPGMGFPDSQRTSFPRSQSCLFLQSPETLQKAGVAGVSSWCEQRAEPLKSKNFPFGPWCACSQMPPAQHTPVPVAWVLSWGCWYMAVVPTLGSLKKEGLRPA